ncbi:hypothetical protein G7054_g4648 [Neopestalotiopsis clavispora]|nr:hypothetical protein G7054_g4648 [Neopestalotiopsis clavispora]
MHFRNLLCHIIIGLSQATAAYVNWKTFKATGVNLGAWLVQEKSLDTPFWNQYGGNATDEWGLCVHLGARCGSVLEQRYASFINTSTIDELAKVNVNVLRIPTHYAAWIQVPGSQLYSGRQVDFLKSISSYAIQKYGMHIIIGLHSLPGGVNGMGIGEKDGNFGWFKNATALSYSYQAVDAALHFIQSSNSPQSFTLSPINEPVDNPDFTKFGTPDALSESGADYTAAYIREVLSRAANVNPPMSVMFQGSFRKESYWSSKFDTSSNLVFDTHNYYFAGRPTTSANLATYICSDAKDSASDGKFPVFIGEWSIQATTNNTLASRESNLNTGLYAWSKYTQGSAPWTARMYGYDSADGEGTQSDYWNYEYFVNQGFIHPESAVGSC